MKKLLRAFAIVAVGLFLVASGAVAGYVANDESGAGSSESEQRLEDEVTSLRGEQDRATRLLRDLCRAGTRLRSAYTGRIIGHAERCERDEVEILIDTVCTDVLKATRTAHLLERECTP